MNKSTPTHSSHSSHTSKFSKTLMPSALLMLTLGALSACQGSQNPVLQALPGAQPNQLNSAQNQPFAEIKSFQIGSVKTETVGQMQVQIDWPGAPAQPDFGLLAIPSATTALKIQISGPGQPDIIQTVQRPAGVYASSYRLIFLTLPAGFGRRITVEAIDSSSKIVARGEASNAVIQAQQLNRQRITLSAVSLPAPTPTPNSGGGGGGGGGGGTPVTPVNLPPNVTGINHTFAFNQTATGYQGQISALATDPEGQPLTYTWSAAAGTFANNGSATADWSGPAGTHNFTVAVSDGVNTTTYSRQLTLGLNQPPLAGGIVATMAFQGPHHQGTLAATGVSDPESQLLTYLWKIPAGAGTLTNANQPVANWTGAPSGSHLVTLEVSDGTNTTTRSEQVNLANQAPVITDIDVSGLNEVTPGTHTGNLSVTASDPENGSLTYAWTVSAGTLAPSATVNPILWHSGLQANASEQYTATVTVSDGQASQTFSKNFSRRNNQAPQVTGVTQNVSETTPGNFNGSLSVSGSDPENNAIDYVWTDSSPSVLASLTGPTVQLKPNIPPGTYNIQVQASDGRLNSAQTPTILVLATNNLPPVINHLSRHTPFSQGMHTGVLGVNASDPENRALTYSWQIISQPGGASLSHATTDSPGFTGPQGSYTVRVTITDGTVAPTQTISGDLTFTLTDPNLAPTVSNVTAGTANYNSQTSLHTVQLIAVGTDPENQALSYSWSSSGGSLSAGSGNPISFTAPAGTYNLSVRANDGTNLSPVFNYPVTFTNPNRPPVISGVTPNLSLNAGQYTGSLAVTASDPDNDSLTYTWSVLQGGSTLAANTGQSVGWTAAPGTHRVQVVARDSQGVDSVPYEYNTTLQANQAPVISGIDVGQDLFILNGSLFARNLTVNATDADSANLTYAWSVQSGTPSGNFYQTAAPPVPSNTLDSASRTVAYRAQPNTVYVVRVQVSDGANTSTYSRSVLLNNNPPYPTSITSNVSCSGGNYIVPLTASFFDPEGHAITGAEWSVVVGSLNQGTLNQKTWTIPGSGGQVVTHQLIIRTSDAYGTSTSTLNLTVGGC